MWLPDFLKTAIKKHLNIEEKSKHYERDVLNNSLKVFNIYPTSKYYQAYLAGFVHGATAKEKERDHFILVLIEDIIDRKKEAEREMATAAVEKV